jgi:lipopolysaccharide biosynthesis glycosyltransferase
MWGKLPGKPMTKSDNLICMSFDDAYLFPALIALNSLQRVAPNLYSIVVINLDNSLNHRSIKMINDWGFANTISIDIKSIQVGKQNLKVDSRISRAAYGRIFSIQHIDSTFLYLDADIFAREDWISIFEILKIDNSSTHCLIAVSEENPNFSTSRNVARAISGDKYFNTGVLIVRPSQIDMESFERSVQYCLDNYSNFHFWSHDQDILNYIFSSKVTKIKAAYNQDLWKVFDSTPKILHFSGFFKPWKMSQGALLLFLSLCLLMDLRNLHEERMRLYRSRSVVKYIREMYRVARFMKSHQLGGVGEEVQFNSKPLNIIAIFKHLASPIYIKFSNVFKSSGS